MRVETSLPARVVLHVVLTFAPSFALEVARGLFGSPFAVRLCGEIATLLDRLGGDRIEMAILLVLGARDGSRHTSSSLAQMLRVRCGEVDAVLESMAFAGRLEYRRDWRRDAELAVQLSAQGQRLAESLLIEFARGLERLAITFPPECRPALDRFTDRVRASLDQPSL